MIGTDLRRLLSSFSLALLLCLLLLGGCMAPPRWHQPVTLDRSSVKEEQGLPGEGAGPEAAAQRPPVEEIKIPVFEKKAPEKRLPPSQPIDPRRLTMVDTPVSLNVEGMPLSDFIIYALGESLKVAFVMDEKMMSNKTPVSLRMPQPLPADQTLNVILGMLEKFGIYFEERSGALYVLQVPPEPRSVMDVRVGTTPANTTADILQVVPLRHIRPVDVEPLIKELFKSGVQIKPYSRENVMILYGRGAQMKPVMDFIATFDVPYLQNKKLFLLRLTYWQTEEFITQLTKILEGVGFSVAKTPKDPGSLFMPIKQLNAILVITPDEQTAKYILGWKDKLDTPEAAGTEFKTYTYVPKYSRASELLESIQKLYGALPSAPETKTMQPTLQRGLASRAGTAAKDSAFEAAGLKMSADDRKNMIIILSKPDVYRNLLNLLQTLDIPARQVLIEATIVELTLTDELKYGVEWFIKNSQDGGSYTLGTLGNLGVSSIGGLSYSFLSKTEQFQALIRAMATSNKANILSTPRLMVLDNMEATIQVGQDVPTVTGELNTLESTVSSNVVRSIQYRSTGVMLKVKPTINTEGLLTLEITQEVSDIGDSGVGDSPIILTRKINTSIVAAHGQTIVLGGLMKENVSKGESKVPLLGDIPLLGNLFKATSKSKDKTELLVLVTPTILTSPDDAAKVSDQLRSELKWFR